MISLIIFSVISFLLLIIGICMMFGKGGILIAGYNYTPKNKRAIKYHKWLLRRFACLLISSSLVFLASGLFKYFNYDLAFYICISFVVIIIICGIIYLNTSNKAKFAQKMVKLSDAEIEQEEKSLNCK